MFVIALYVRTRYANIFRFIEVVHCDNCCLTRYVHSSRSSSGIIIIISSSSSSRRKNRSKNKTGLKILRVGKHHFKCKPRGLEVGLKKLQVGLHSFCSLSFEFLVGSFKFEDLKLTHKKQETASWPTHFLYGSTYSSLMIGNWPTHYVDLWECFITKASS